MGNRVIDSEVKEIMDTNLSDTTPFIDIANRFVTDKLTGKGLSDNQLRDVELMIAAHFVSLQDQRHSSEKIGDASVTYQGNTGEGLRGTKYGQTAIMLDESGTLATAGKKPFRFVAVQK